MKINQIIETIEETIMKAIEIIVTGVYYAIMLLIGITFQFLFYRLVYIIVGWLFF